MTGLEATTKAGDDVRDLSGIDDVDFNALADQSEKSRQGLVKTQALGGGHRLGAYPAEPASHEQADGSI